MTSSTAATTTAAATAPAKRGTTSMAPPIRSASEATVDTTSPVGTRRVTLVPARRRWRETCWVTRYMAWSQQLTAARCRSVPAPACRSTSPASRPDQVSSAGQSTTVAPEASVPNPSSMPRPSTTGISASATMNTMPRTEPQARVRHCPRATPPR